MIDTTLVAGWFPDVDIARSHSVAELSHAFGDLPYQRVLHAIVPGCVGLVVESDDFKRVMCQTVVAVFTLESIPLSLAYMQTIVAVIVAWMTPYGSGVRRNLPLTYLLALAVALHAPLIALSAPQRSHLRVLARAFPPALQCLMIQTPGVDRAVVAQELFAFILSVVFPPPDAEALNYAGFMKGVDLPYLGFCHALRTFARKKGVPGFPVRVTEHFLSLRGLSKDKEAERYRLWRDMPVEALVFLPCASGSALGMRSRECRGIREIRPHTQLHEHRSRRVRSTRKKFRLFPRFRKPLTPLREVELNISVRQKLGKNMPGRVAADRLDADFWFHNFPDGKQWVDIGHTCCIMLPLVQLYIWVLHLATTSLRLTFHSLFVNPYPLLLILRLFQIALDLKFTPQRRQAMSKVMYVIKRYAHIETRICKVVMYPDDPFDISQREYRRLFSIITAGSLPRRYSPWSSFFLARTRFLSHRAETFASRFTNVSGSARKWPRSTVLAAWSRVDLKNAPELRVRVFKGNWNVPFPYEREHRIARTMKMCHTWARHFGFPIPENLQETVHNMYLDLPAPDFDSCERYLEYISEFAPCWRKLARPPSRSDGLGYVVGPLDHNTNRRSIIPESDVLRQIGYMILKDQVHFKVRLDVSLEEAARRRERLWAKALPARLQLRTPILPDQLPHFYILLKFKCWGSRALTCTREGHCHFRTITSTANNNPHLKRVKRRAMRALATMRQTESHLCWQLWGLHTMTDHVEELLRRLLRPPEFAHVCICHGRPKPCVVACQLDACCFYENAAASRGCERARQMSVRVTAREGTPFVTVDENGKKGKMGRSTRGNPAKKSSDYLHADECVCILDTSRLDNTFRVGDSVLVERSNSWPMGGEESAEAVGCDAHEDEVELHVSIDKQKLCGWYYPPFTIKQLIGGIRCIDNNFLLSFMFCEETLVSGGQALFPQDFGMSLETKGPQQQFLAGQVTLDYDSGDLVITPTSHNDKYARLQKAVQPLTRLAPYFSDNMSPVGYMRQFFMQALARFRFLCPADSTLALPAILDMYWEARRLGYSHAHVAQVFRKLRPGKATPAVRIFRSALKNHGRQNSLTDFADRL